MRVVASASAKMISCSAPIIDHRRTQIRREMYLRGRSRPSWIIVALIRPLAAIKNASVPTFWTIWSYRMSTWVLVPAIISVASISEGRTSSTANEKVLLKYKLVRSMIKSGFWQAGIRTGRAILTNWVVVMQVGATSIIEVLLTWRKRISRRMGSALTPG